MSFVPFPWTYLKFAVYFHAMIVSSKKLWTALIDDLTHMVRLGVSPPPRLKGGQLSRVAAFFFDLLLSC